MDVKRISLHAPIPEIYLRDFSNTLGTFFKDEANLLDEDGSTQWLQDFISALISTAATAGLKPTHRVAACNVLCGSVEQCSDHSVESVRVLAFSERTCKSLLDIFLDRYESAKAKSMKQVLTTLIKVLSKALKLFGTSTLRDQAVQRQLEVLFSSLDHVKAKPALYGLTLFLSRKLITRCELLTIFQRHIEFEAAYNGSDEASVAFIGGVLNWISYQDVAPTIGPFLSNFFSETISADEIWDKKDEGFPPWAVPLWQIFQTNVDSIQAFKNYVFPYIFKSNIYNYWQFLQFLQIEESLGLKEERLAKDALQGSYQHQRNMLLFSSLQIGKDLGIVQEQDNLYCPGISVIENRIYISDLLLSRLLEHVSHAVRITGLELLLNSPSSTRPFTEHTLESIERFLPQMMADVDSNFRGQLQSLLKLLVDRLRSITSNQSKALEVKRKTKDAPIVAQDKLDPSLGMELQKLQNSLKAHESTLHKLIDSFTSELHPNASYQAHISALKGIIIIMKSGLDCSINEKFWSKQAKGDITWPFRCLVVNESSSRALFDLLLDPFDDVRQAALTALKMLHSKETPSFENLAITSSKQHFKMSSNAKVISANFPDFQKPNLYLAMQRGYDIMLQSGRIDHADGIGRLFDLLSFVSGHKNDGGGLSPSVNPMGIAENVVGAIEDAVHVAQTSLATAVSKQPIHGLFISLRYVIESIIALPRASLAHHVERMQKLSHRIYSIISNIWECVRPLLCNDAPEGYIPIELEDQIDITTRDVLSYAWRALKESSLLLRAAIEFNLICQGSQTPLDPVTLENYGNICFIQLSELRHRGAFSTVSQTFSMVCESASTSTIESDRHLIMKWYNMIIDLIRKKGKVTTRRSAGIPALMVAVLSADKMGSLFEQAIKDLMTLAQSEVVETEQGAIDLPQVHTLNSLKMIFTSPKLGENSEPFIVDLLNLAATNISSKIWSIRNCCLMLFRSLIDRLLGSHESMDDTSHPKLETNSRLSYESYPGLLELVVSLLSQMRRISQSMDGVRVDQMKSDGDDPILTETIFPVLDLLRRAAPPESYRDEIRALVLSATSASHWHVRDMAARTFASLVPQTQLAQIVQSCLQFDTVNVNEIHGRMMCILRILQGIEKALDGTFNIEILFDVAHPICSSELPKSLTNPLLEAAWVDILNTLGKSMLYGPTGSLESPNDSGQQAMSFDLVRQYENSCDLLWNHCQDYSSTRLGSSILTRSILLNKVIRGLVKANFEPSDSQLDTLSAFDRSIDTDDPDTSLHVIEALIDILNPMSIDVKHMVAIQLCTVLDRCTIPDIRSALEQILLHLLDDISRHGRLKCWNSIQSNLKRQYFFKDSVQVKTPLQIESSIELWGYCLGSRWYAGQESSPLEIETKSWIATIRVNLDSFNEFPIRYSAASSIRNLTSIERAFSKMQQALQVNLAFTIADILVDDDDEIRELGSEAAIAICNGSANITISKRVVPPVAQNILGEYIVEHFSDSVDALKESLFRLVGHERDDNTLISVRSRATLALKRDTSLFSKEKQNLYLNETKEAYFWTTVLKRMNPHESSYGSIKEFDKWTSEGLEHLKQVTEQNFDGPLGWTSTPDAFALVMRVIYSAEVLLSWRARAATRRTCTIRRLLHEFGEAGKQADLHGMCLQAIDCIVQQSVLEKLQCQ